MGLIIATALLRCPVCHRGNLYQKSLRMNKTCPKCDFKFEREEGYFVGAMYASYGFQLATVTPVMIILLVVSQSPVFILGVLVPQILLQVPVAYLYSRAIWMAVDTHFDPPLPLETGAQVASPAEKARTRIR